MEPLSVFSPETRAWFEGTFDAPTPAQVKGWPAIATGGHTLIQAPTGSGKTLAAFLYAIDRLTPSPGEGLRVLYVSPLKALNYDVERNLRGPLAGLDSRLRVAVRTGDTPQAERAAMLRDAPDILITTPESLFLLLTSRARELLRSVDTLILDEVHAVAGTKRGAHLAVSVERLQALRDEPIQRIALSATQRPLEEIGRFVSGGQPIQLVDAGVAKELDLEVVVPVEDMRELSTNAALDQRQYVDGDSGITAGLEVGSQSIWPSIYPALLELVRAHRSTIVFVNNRRLAERLALRLNELAEAAAGAEGARPMTLARAHHGSLSREQRTQVEEELKAGRIPCLVATSSLELGIDMGAVDLVIQVESPKSVARGLQRVGRAGHSLGEVSRGRIFPKFRADLLESAVVAARMREGAIEETQIPRNPLDVLAQQIVAIVAEAEVTVDELYDLVTRAYPFATLSRPQLENVLDMLAGRYPSDEFAELRPRIVWDRTAGVIRGRPGARRLAVTNAGTIPDRGLFGVFIADGGGRVGELDEEMVYEARAGQVIMLGASSWRIEEITRDRVLVSPAPGVPGAVPFWKGEGVGRPYELGEAIGRFSRELLAKRKPSVPGLDPRAEANLIAYLREQERVTGAVPSDRTVVVERFRDEIGDWRVCILTPFGGRVHAPWAMAVGARLRESLGIEVQSIWSDDGIAFHLPDADSPPATDQLMLEPGEVEELVLGELGQTALFGARFRENAARALLIPRRRPGERTPLWQQRLKAQGLLQVARRYASFPVVLETYRECLQDVFDLPSLKRLLAGIAAREIDLVDVETASASPFAASLLFDYIATYMYEDDTPPAERRAQALSLDRDLLRELLGQEELRELIDRDALAEVEQSLRPAARDPDHLHDLLRLRGDLRPGEFDEAHAAILEAERRAIRIRVAGEERLAAAEDAGRYRDALGAMPPSGLPDVFLEAVPDALASLVARWTRGRGPFTTAEANEWFGRDVEPILRELEREERLVRGELRPGGTEREWCDADVLRRLRRASLAALRREVEPAEQAALGRFLPSWHGIDRRASLREALIPLQGLALPVSLWESEVLPRRVPGYRPEQLDQLCASGELVWTGAGLDRVAVFFREDAALLGRPAAAPAPEGDIHDAIRRALAGGALFWTDLLAASGLEDAVALPALWDLVWAGEATNDAWAPLRAERRYQAPRPDRRVRRFSRTRAVRTTATQGRWSPAASLFTATEPDRRALAELLLERQGIVTRDSVRGEGIAGGYGAVYAELRALETLGTCRRGYFVEGLGGAQFALGGAVERLRELRPREGDEPEPLVLAAADPAQPYGAALQWPKRSGARAARVAGAHVVLLGGEAALFVERGGRSLVPLREPDPEWLRPALAALVDFVRGGGAKRLAVERFDGELVGETVVMPLLLEAGFLAGPRRAVLRA
jgi:ATP-dependent helicase Lhr and Lhr-like helicase